MTLTLYTFEDEHGQPFGDWHTLNYDEAKRHAAAHGLLVVANEFEWAGSEDLDDYRARRRRKKVTT